MDCIALLAALGLSSCAPAPIPAPTGEPAFYRSLAAPGAKVDADSAQAMLSIYRRNKGAALVAPDAALQAFAQNEADAMARANATSPRAPDAVTQALRAAGTPRGAAVETRSAGYHTLAEAFSGWRQSKPDDAHLLDPRMRRFGLATAYVPGSKYKVFWALVLSD